MFSEAEALMSKLPKKAREQIIESIKQETGVYRYNPEFKGTKSPPVKPLKTELQPGEAPLEMPQKEKLFPDQLSTVQEGKAALSKAVGKEQAVGMGLIKPKPLTHKSPKPKQLDIKPSEIDVPAHIMDLMEQARKSKSPNVAKTLRARAVEEYHKKRTKANLPKVHIDDVEKAVKAKQEMYKTKLNEFRKKKGLPLF